MSRQRNHMAAVHNEIRDAVVQQFGEKTKYDNLMMPVK